ncbi:MAG: gamma-glutamyltransferase family protein [Sporolactobacillus sp.]
MNNYQHFRYLTKRTPIYGRRGMVATTQPLAAQAGLDMLKKGGNAIDAAIAAAACLPVVEPTSNGLGSDAFALIWTGGKLYGLNASGPAPRTLSIGALRARGLSAVPTTGLTPVTVPGAPAAWAACSRRFGRLPLPSVLEPAITYAAEGYPVSPVVAANWQRAYAQFKAKLRGDMFASWFDTFAPNGRVPRAGEIWSSPEMADSLSKIATTAAGAFYHGELAEAIDRFSRKYEGFIRKADLAAFVPEWVEPICTSYRGYDVWELPPNGQGLVVLMALGTLAHFQIGSKPDAETYHRQIEALKLAFSDGKACITDPREMNGEVAALLSAGYAASRAQQIGSQALHPAPGTLPTGGTVYLAAADGEGNMVSFIQSNYAGFGSGIVIPGTGISLQNRGSDFSLNEADANCLKPGKRTYHTIIPGFLTKAGKAVGPFGVMGGYMQPQGQLQVLSNTIDCLMDPQAALDAPRWQWLHDKTVMVEPDFPLEAARELAARGHDIRIALDGSSFGRGQIIWRDAVTGVLTGASESRADGIVAAW